MATPDGSEAASTVLDHHDRDLEEQQPFLSSPDGEAHHEKHSRRPSSSWTTWQFALFALLVVISVLGLAALPLTFNAPATSSPEPEHHDTPPPPEPSHDDDVSHETDASHDSLISYPETIPPTPQLRDPSAYILSPSWDASSPPSTRVYNFTILAGDLNPDGVFRPMLLINNRFPGPLIECNDGDTLVVHVANRAPNATALHFHGLFQNGTNLMDGTVGVTQCPIAPGTSFTYRFTVRGQAGTYWYHAHHSAQASDGLLGPVVIHARDEPAAPDYETDRVVMVQDHYHNLTSELLMDYLAPDGENDEPVPDNALINGHGVRSCADFPGWPCDDTHVSAPVFDLAPGRRHRLRIINVGAFAEFQIQFDEHPFAVVEVDGVDVHPEPFHRLNILPAQRYSVVLETNVTSAASFWMRARMVTHCFTTPNARLQPEIRAVIRYADPAESSDLIVVEEPTSKDWAQAIEILCRDLDTSLLRPVEAISPPPADDIVPLRASFRIGAWRLSRGFFNDSSWHANATHPSLHRYLSSPLRTATTDLSLSANTDVFARDSELVLETVGSRVVDLVINNFDDGAHPFHLHGHRLFLLAQGQHGYPPEPALLPAWLAENGRLDNPLRRDTVTVEGYRWAVVRVVLDNPGMWTFHCHNTWHAESGMVMQLLVRSEVVRQWQVPPEMNEMCELEGVTSGLRPDDSIWFGSF